MIKHLLISLSIILTLSTSLTRAQDTEAVCTSPFVEDADASVMVMLVDGAVITDDVFAERIQFEHAFNFLNYQIRLSQLSQRADAFASYHLPEYRLLPQRLRGLHHQCCRNGVQCESLHWHDNQS